MKNVLIVVTVLALLSVLFVDLSAAQTPAPTEMAPAATAMPAATTMMPEATAVPAAPECMSDYMVKAGDRLLRIAASEYGITGTYRSLTQAVAAIVDATNAKAATDKTYATITNTATIRAGWKLCVPSFTAPTAMPSPATTAPAMKPTAMPSPAMTAPMVEPTATP